MGAIIEVVGVGAVFLASGAVTWAVTAAAYKAEEKAQTQSVQEPTRKDEAGRGGKKTDD